MAETVLVTGGCGFIGSALVRRLVKEGHYVLVYDDFSSGDPVNLQDVLNTGKVWIYKGSILESPRQKVTLEDLLTREGVTRVFHLAAQPYIPHCYEDPEVFLQVNVLGTLHVLRACKRAGVKRMLHYSTSEVYGSAQYVPMDESHPTNPLSTYAASKLAADRLCYTYSHEHDLPVVILRQFNCYGERETQPYVIPEIIAQLSRGSRLKLGNLQARRDFTYVDDAVEGASALMNCDEAWEKRGEVFNLGSGVDVSVRELTHLIMDLMGVEAEVEVEPGRLRPLDVERLCCDSAKLRRYTSWKPKTDLRGGLGKTIGWFKTHGSRWIWEEKVRGEEAMWRP